MKLKVKGLEIDISRNTQPPTMDPNPVTMRGYHNTVIVGQTKRFTYFVSIPNRMNPKMVAYRVRTRIMEKLFNHLYDQDCDGTTTLITDRLTDGKIFTYSDWNFYRAGGTMGAYIRIFGRRYPDPNHLEDESFWTIPNWAMTLIRFIAH